MSRVRVLKEKLKPFTVELKDWQKYFKIKELNNAIKENPSDTQAVDEIAERLFKQKEEVKAEQDREELTGSSFFLGTYHIIRKNSEINNVY